MDALRHNVETLAAAENKTPLEIITDLQAGAAKLGNAPLLDALGDLKWEYIDANTPSDRWEDACIDRPMGWG